jgi:hypothetical protein
METTRPATVRNERPCAAVMASRAAVRNVGCNRRAMTRILHGIVKDCTDMGVRRIALGWYTPESWQQLKAVATDELEDSFEEFVHKMTKQIQQWEVNGFEVVKVYIDIDHLVAWCKRHGYRVDSRSRAAYGTLLAMHDGELFDINTPIEGLP